MYLMMYRNMCCWTLFSVLLVVVTASDPTIRLFQRIIQISQKIDDLPSRPFDSIITSDKPTIHPWPTPDVRPIPFDVSAVADRLKLVIQAAMDFWSRYTCVRWRPDGSAPDRLIFIYGTECFAPIGFLKDSHTVSLSSYCNQSGLVARQIGHTLGLVHEHRRPNRDEHIVVNFNNLQPGHTFDLQPYQQEQLGILGDNHTYDMGSIMHFDGRTTDFAVTKTENLIYAKNPLYQRTMGQRKSPTFLDLRRINTAYCSHMCESTKLQCRYGGYPNPNNCSECLCPSGLGGFDCGTAAPSTDNICGGQLRAESQWTTLTSPRLTDSFSNPTAITSCNWLITADSPVHLEFHSDHFNLPCNDICDSYVEVKIGPDLTPTGYRLCCQSQLKDAIVTADSGVIVVLLRTKAMRGFSARYRADPVDRNCTDALNQDLFICRNFSSATNVSTVSNLTSFSHDQTSLNMSQESLLLQNATTNHSADLFMNKTAVINETHVMNETRFNDTQLLNATFVSNGTILPNLNASHFFNATTNGTNFLNETFNNETARWHNPNFTSLVNSSGIKFFGSLIDQTGLNNSDIDDCLGQNCSSNNKSHISAKMRAMLKTINESECAKWSAWTPCNYKCGGCGRKVRFRTCTPDKLSTITINDMEETACNLLPCTYKGHLYSGHVIGTVKLRIRWGCCEGFLVADNCCNQTAIEPVDVLTDIDEFTQNRYFRTRTNEHCSMMP